MPRVTTSVNLTPGKAFLLGYLPARRLIEVAKHEILKPKNDSVANRGLSPAFARAARTLEEQSAARDAAAIAAKVDERLAMIASSAGITFPGSAIHDETVPAWLDALASEVRTHLTTPVLEAAWNAGEAARRVTISVELLKEVTRRRVKEPENADLRARAAELARELEESTATLRVRFEETGLPLVISNADLHADMVRLTTNLHPTTKGGFDEIARLAKDLDSFSEAAVGWLEVAPPPKPIPAPAGSPERIEEETLLRRIIEAPHDLGLRRRFAELVEPRNDPRARLIRLQLSPSGDEGETEAYNLVRMHPDWSAPLEALGARDVKLAAGFPEAITIDADVLLERARELFSAAPLKTLHVRGAKGRVGEVVRLDRLATIEALDLDDQGVTDDDLVTLAASPHASRLRRLDLRFNPITARGIEALVVSPHLKRLEMVNLDGNPADPVDRLEHYDETNTHYVPTEAGKAIEAKYGRIRWLHPGQAGPEAPKISEQAIDVDPRLSRLTNALVQLGIDVEPVLRVVAAVGIENVFVGIGTLSGRVQLLVPSRADAVALVAPVTGVTAVPERSMLLVSAERDRPITGALVIGGATTVRQAIDDVAPRAARDLWLPIVEQLSKGTIKNRTCALAEEHGMITVSFPPRSGDAESTFAADLAALCTRLDVPASWRRVYEEAGPGLNVSVTIECGPKGPLARLGLRFGQATWDRAIDLAKALVDIDRARGAAVRMGVLASGFGAATVLGVEAVIDSANPDLTVWLAVR